MRTVVIGVGNPILSDDSVGIRVSRQVDASLRRAGGRDVAAGAEDGIEVTELYAGGLRLMEALSGFDRAFLIDAVETGDGPPGTVFTFARQDLRALRNISGVHDTSLGMALQLAERLDIPLPGDIRIWGVEIGEGMAFSEELTPAVAAAVPRVVGDVMEALQS